ncbi:LOW QUALITY PROTEIN: centrosomal protein of 72 kDa [Pholidichthys leucotaenia]
MAVESLTTITEQWLCDRLQLKHPCLGDVRSLTLPGTYEEKIRHLGNALNNFIRLKSLDLSCNALVSVEGVQHLKMLERLILYYNCIPSIEEVKVLFKLPVLRELDLRLNPLTKSYLYYRPYLVHAMPNLRKLDSCSVRDTERKAAIMQFSSDLLPEQKSSSPNLAKEQRSSDHRLALIDCLTKRLSLLVDSQDVVMNFAEKSYRDQSETVSDSVHKEARETKEEHFEDFTQQSSTPVQETAQSILRSPPTKSEAERPKVTFGPYIEKRQHVPGKQKVKEFPKQTRHAAKGHFTPNPDQSPRHSSSFINIPPSPRCPGLNLSDPSNPTLYPPHLTYSSFNNTEGGSSQPQAEKKQKDGYRKPLQMLLSLVDKHWRGERSLHQNNNFLSQAIQILSMMESDISCREAEVKTLRREVNAERFQAAAREEEHKAEVHNLCVQLEEARRATKKLNGQLRIVLEENVTLQKQHIKLERQYLKSIKKSSLITQIREAQNEVEELRREIEGLRKKEQVAEKSEVSNELQKDHRWEDNAILACQLRSLETTDKCLLAVLKESEY